MSKDQDYPEDLDSDFEYPVLYQFIHILLWFNCFIFCLEKKKDDLLESKRDLSFKLYKRNE